MNFTLIIVTVNKIMKQKKFWSIISIIILSSQFVFAYSNETDRIFTVEGIEVYQDSGSLENSKTFAKNKAVIEGFGRLIHKLIPISHHDKIYKIRNVDMLSAVKQITPTKERMTNHSYIATIKIHFDQRKIEEVLNRYGIRYKTQFSDEILFIPIFYENETSLSHDWEYKWMNLDDEHKLLKIDVFTNSLAMRLENNLTSLFDPYSKFKSVIQEYNTKDLIIVFGQMKGDKLELIIRFLSPSRDEIKYLIVNKDIRELNINFFNRAINELLDKIDEEWKGIKSFNQNILFSSKVKIKAENPKVWSAIRFKLNSITALKNYHVTQSSLGKMQVVLNYIIPTPSFRELLLQHGIIMVKENKQWVLSLNKKNR